VGVGGQASALLGPPEKENRENVAHAGRPDYYLSEASVLVVFLKFRCAIYAHDDKSIKISCCAI
jgi:hypothetical protein